MCTYCIVNVICAMSEKLCLKWNDFQENVNTAFENLRKNEDFSDVTLACEDGQQFELHKVILASSMRGVKSEDLNAIIDFLYCGQANVFQENLDSFLAIAEELKLKGLMGNTDEKGVKPEETPSVHMNTAAVARKYHNDQQLTNVSNRYETRVAIPTTSDSGNLKALDDQVKSMMEKSQNIIQAGNS